MKMNKKGFTLIELLAVIVVLAIIALIATPIVMNVINDAQKGANARSVEGYMKAVESSYYQYMLDHNGKEPKDASGLVNVTSLTINVNGSEVNCGKTIKVENSKFTATCEVNNQTFEYKDSKATIK